MMAIEEAGTLLSAGTISSSSLNDSPSNLNRDSRPFDVVSAYIDNANNSNQFWIVCVCLALGNAADAVEIMCVGYIITEIKNMTTSDQTLLTSAVFVGMLFGGLFCGYLSDIVGRKPTLIVSLALNTIAGVSSAFAPSVTALIVFRVIGGIGIGGSVPVVFSLGVEVFPSDIRGKMLSVVASFWMVGAIYTAAVAWIILGYTLDGHHRIIPTGTWRIFAVLCALPAALALLVTYLFVPESPRFLLNQGRCREAAVSLQRLCGSSTLVEESALAMYAHHHHHHKQQQQQQQLSSPSSSSSSTTLYHHNDNHDNIAVSNNTHNSNNNSINHHNVINNNSWSPSSLFYSLSSSSSLMYLFQKSLRKTTLCLGAIWFTLSFGSYGMSTWIATLFTNIGLTNPYADAFFFALANLPGNIISIYFIDSIGRRTLLSWGLFLAAVSSLVFALDLQSPFVVVTAASLFNAFSVMAWNSLDCMSVEYFPTRVRTTAMGVLSSAGRIGAVSAQFVNGNLQRNMVALLLVTSTCMMTGGICAWCLDDDTAGSPLTDGNYDDSHVKSDDDRDDDGSGGSSSSKQQQSDIYFNTGDDIINSHTATVLSATSISNNTSSTATTDNLSRYVALSAH